ncbi:YsnF/AvaK domain-containing protein [Rhodopila sp.]|uniref:YsnF/AvaK domain-containing protein n=1 Tax=Rhodopila sp. TaxID=2480087 RepID=UPI003D0A56B5
MRRNIIVAAYDTPAQAARAAQDLETLGIPENAISVHTGHANASSATATQQSREPNFWSSLFGSAPKHAAAAYDRSVASGSAVVTAKVREAQVPRATRILESHGPIDIDNRSASLAQTRTATHEPLRGAVPRRPPAEVAGSSAGSRDADAIQLSEERLTVGKRLVNRGRTRIRRFAVETPVEQQVTLHDEKVTLDRRPVADWRPITHADFIDKTIEVTETSEEAVVDKQAFVTEELTVRKRASERLETVRDIVRREDVEIKQIPAKKVSPATTDVAPPRTRKI